ncbi:U1 zinc finger-domain-containing protein [Pavlovales sp. CCMP2436]|nr:U1 zinc finger-domain-containing protein [Pavlovales sp. CCMP2436]
MPRFYCEYCEIFLTHSSAHGRRQHNSGRKHIMNVIDYYANFQLQLQEGATSAPLPSGLPPLPTMPMPGSAGGMFGLPTAPPFGFHLPSMPPRPDQVAQYGYTLPPPLPGASGAVFGYQQPPSMQPMQMHGPPGGYGVGAGGPGYPPRY